MHVSPDIQHIAIKSIHTWSEILRFVNHQNIVLVQLRSSQLPQFDVAVMWQSNVAVVQVRHFRPHLPGVAGQILSNNDIKLPSAHVK